MNRRQLLTGLTAGGILLPLDWNEPIRRFWALDRTMSGSTLHISYGYPFSQWALSKEPEFIRMVVHYLDGATETRQFMTTPDVATPVAVRIGGKDHIQGAALYNDAFPKYEGQLRMTFGHVPWDTIG